MKTTFITNPFDLANYSNPIGHLFQQPKTAAEWEQYVLTKEQIDSFKENGYLSGIKILTEQQVDALNVELIRLQSGRPEDKELFYHYESNESEDPDKVLFHAIGAWRVTPGFHDLIWAPAYRMAAYQLLGQPFRLFHDQLFCKPAKHGGVVAWHQDFSYWTFTKPMQHLTCWIGLDDANIDNGCLYYIPGSHKWGLLPVTGLAGDMDAVRQILDTDQMLAFEKKFANELPKGYASFHHPLMMHGSYANSSQRSRRAVVINSMGQDTMGNTAGYERLEALGHFPPMPQDQLLSSQFFPKLFPDREDDIQRLINSVPTISSLD
ncbi:phytanoyl-CoA dioxygenase family protein [Pedobacter sp. HDW13]|uniref:phytanoyl-CoA dioxygenase family protein n=1 Tax=Pedobacter sp. HDW13 TaxID=2714940 RepID=UPI0014093FC4|nr:phytanoyl-CoA dioxygenase family protein [Pedobacter sp. HDW13]QIL40519.1 phytanoyl-CoA dioxygenase family protein [Pedobacter sp. HDW13]